MKITKRSLFFLLVLFIVSDILHYVSIVGYGTTAATYTDMTIKYTAIVIILLYLRLVPWKQDFSKTFLILFYSLLCWNAVTALRGMQSAHGYLDWRMLFLTIIPFLLGPVIIQLGKKPQVIKTTVRFLYKYLFPFGFVLIPLAHFTNPELYSRIALPVITMILFLPYIRPNRFLLTFFVALLSMAVVLDFRTNIIKIVLSTLILTTYYMPRGLGIKVVRLGRVIFFLMPLLLIFLAVIGDYNIFANTSQNNGYQVKDNQGQAESLTQDTRTLLFSDVFATLQKNSTWLVGGGAVTTYSTDRNEFQEGKGRYATEVGALNLLLYSGLIGLLLYGSLLCYTSYQAIFRSNNWLCKMIGLFLATKWLLLFVEEFTQLDMNYYFLWLVVGLVANQRFRALSDKDLREYFNFSTRKKTPHLIKMPPSLTS